MLGQVAIEGVDAPLEPLAPLTVVAPVGFLLLLLLLPDVELAGALGHGVGLVEVLQSAVDPRRGLPSGGVVVVLAEFGVGVLVGGLVAEVGVAVDAGVGEEGLVEAGVPEVGVAEFGSDEGSVFEVRVVEGGTTSIRVSKIRINKPSV